MHRAVDPGPECFVCPVEMPDLFETFQRQVNWVQAFYQQPFALCADVKSYCGIAETQLLLGEVNHECGVPG